MRAPLLLLLLACAAPAQARPATFLAAPAVGMASLPPVPPAPAAIHAPVAADARARFLPLIAREAAGTLPATPAPEGDSQDDRISRFILANPPATAGEPAEISPAQTPPVQAAGTPAAAPAKSARKSSGRRQQSSEPGENTLLSESLAKIYIKSHKYERAFEILSRLSLEFPEKSRYFADQLRFLRKLIIIQQHRDQSSASSAEGAPTEKN